MENVTRSTELAPVIASHQERVEMFYEIESTFRNMIAAVKSTTDDINRVFE
jgi:hypothetical protein